MDAGHTVIGGVLSVARDGQSFERLVVAVKSDSARPEILSPIPGSVLPGGSVTWKWSDNGRLVGNWWLTVGTSIGGTNLFNSGSLAAVSQEHTVSGLPTAGETVFVRLSYQEGGVWLFTDVQYTAYTGLGPDPDPDPIPPPASQNDIEELTSRPDLSIWSLIAMILGIWNMVGTDTRRRAARI